MIQPIPLSNRTLYMNQICQAYERAGETNDETTVVVELTNGEVIHLNGEDKKFFYSVQDILENATLAILYQATGDEQFAAER